MPPALDPASIPPPAIGNRLLLTLGEAAGELTISRRTLSRLISTGEFPSPLKIGRASRIDRADLAAYLEKLRRTRGEKLGTS